MNEQLLKNLLNHHPWGELVNCEGTVGSTNSLVKALALQAAPEGTAVLADAQTAGRGRLGRSFYSPNGSGLYLSVLLRPQKPAQALFDLTARVAVAVCRAVEAVCGIALSVKWVNDLCLNGKKLGGILTELVGGAVPAAIVGIGINCTQTEFPEDLRSIAGSILSETGITVSREQLAAAILQQLSCLFDVDWLPYYRARCLTLGKEVRVISADGQRKAVALDVTDTAALLVEYPDGSREAVSSGEVSVRGLYGYLDERSYHEVKL